VSRGTQESACAAFDFGYRTFTVYGQAFQPVLLSNYGSRDGGPTTPDPRKDPVWANSRSLAATREITFVFFS
jgi:hypothetical protein